METSDIKQPPLVGALKLRPAAKFLSISPITLRRLVGRGLIRPNKCTRHLLFDIRELQKFLEH